MKKLVGNFLVEWMGDILADLAVLLAKSLIFVPLFGGLWRVVTGHWPNGDMWTGFLIAAVFYTNASRELRGKLTGKFRHRTLKPPADVH